MPGHEPAPPAPPSADIFSVYSYDIDGDFAKDESLLGGAVSIDGIFLMSYISKLETDDGDGSSELYINEKYAAVVAIYRDHEYIGLMGSTGDSGAIFYFMSEKIDTPHTSFDIKSWEAAVTYYHRTYKVIILNSKT